MSCTSENYFFPALTDHILLNYTVNLVDTCFVNQNLNFTRTTDQRWSWTIRDFSGSVKHLVLKDIFPRRTPPTGTSAWYIARHSEFASKSSVNPARHIGIAQTFLFPFELFPDVRFSFDFFFILLAQKFCPAPYRRRHSAYDSHAGYALNTSDGCRTRIQLCRYLCIYIYTCSGTTS